MNKIICLTPIKNGESHIERFFKINNPYVDSYIILDDNSIDSTVSLVKKESKVVSLLTKKASNVFDDLENRNILLAEAEKFTNPGDWIIWLDVDEVLYKFVNPSFIATEGLLLFKKVHLWNEENLYNTEYPFSDKGIVYKYRGFSVKELVEWKFPISSDRLHFSLIPSNYSTTNIIIPQGLILHYGNLRKEDREDRYLRYKKEDPENKLQTTGYEHFLNHNPLTDNIINLEL